MTQAYPLQWPPGYGRTARKSTSRFKATVSSAVNFVQEELRRFGNDTGKKVTDLIISSNVSLGNNRPVDSGIAVYFRWDGIDCCIAVDMYIYPEDNLQAIGKVIEADRTKMRHGGLNIVRASMRGHAHLPPPKGPDGQLAPPWRMVLEMTGGGGLAEAESTYRALCKKHHPDMGGDPAKFNQITDAIRQAREEFRV